MYVCIFIGSSAADKTSTSTSTSSSANIMSTLRNLRIPFRGSVGAGPAASGQREGAAGGDVGASNWPHDRKPDAKTVCLWSDATEVIEDVLCVYVHEIKMYVCMYVCIYTVCMYVRYVCMYVCMMYVCIHTCMYDVCMYTCMYVRYVCIYLCMYGT